jgi:hypothetical protein
VPDELAGRERMAVFIPRRSIALRLMSGVQGRLPSGVLKPTDAFFFTLSSEEGKKWW